MAVSWCDCNEVIDDKNGEETRGDNDDDDDDDNDHKLPKR